MANDTAEAAGQHLPLIVAAAAISETQNESMAKIVVKAARGPLFRALRQIYTNDVICDVDDCKTIPC